MGRHKRVVKTQLRTASIQRSIRELESYKGELSVKIDHFMKFIAYEAEKYCKSICPVGLGTGEGGGHLRDSIKAVYDPSTKIITVRAGSYWAVFVEYGTGIVGKNSPHPDPGSWKYRGTEYWVYPITRSTYEAMKSEGMPVSMNKSGQCFAATKGMESRPFMYMTAQFINDLIDKKARSFFP
ncbi:MAG: hypothetical protein RSD63_08225 [Eubacterium sp.]